MHAVVAACLPACPPDCPLTCLPARHACPPAHLPARPPACLPACLPARLPASKQPPISRVSCPGVPPPVLACLPSPPTALPACPPARPLSYRRRRQASASSPATCGGGRPTCRTPPGTATASSTASQPASRHAVLQPLPPGWGRPGRACRDLTWGPYFGWWLPRQLLLSIIRSSMHVAARSSRRATQQQNA